MHAIIPPTEQWSNTPHSAGPPARKPLFWGIRGKNGEYQYVVYSDKTWDVIETVWEDWDSRLAAALPPLGKSVRPTDQEWVLVIHSIFERLKWSIPPEVAHAPDLDVDEVYGAERPRPKKPGDPSLSS